MSDSAVEDRPAMLQLYCDRRGLAMTHGTDLTDAALRKIELILGELVCELDMMKAGLKMAGRERKSEYINVSSETVAALDAHIARNGPSGMR